MYSIALASFLSKDGLDITCLCSNKTKADILCSKELQKLADKNPDNFHLHHTLTRVNSKDTSSGTLTGRVTWKLL